MKTLRVSDNVHHELTRLLGEMIAQSGKTQTYSAVVEALVSRAVYLSPDICKGFEELMESGRQLGYSKLEDFIEDAITEKLHRLSSK